jgi:hypothetical protein
LTCGGTVTFADGASSATTWLTGHVYYQTLYQF